MQIDNDVKRFIEDHMYLIENNRWDLFEDKLNDADEDYDYLIMEPWKVWQIILDAGIDLFGLYHKVPKDCFGDRHDLTTIRIPEGVTEIGNRAFYGCKNLKSISLPSTINKIGYHVFKECDALRLIYFNGELEQWHDIKGMVGAGVSDNVTIVCKDGEF